MKIYHPALTAHVSTVCDGFRVNKKVKPWHFDDLLKKTEKYFYLQVLVDCTVSSFCCSTPHLSSTMITLFMCSNATNLASDYATIVYGTGSFRTVKDHELFCSCFCSLPEQIVELPCVRAAVDCQCPVARNRV